MDTKINLCDTCQNCFANCDAKVVEFGDGLGGDNVIDCSTYKKQED